MLRTDRRNSCIKHSTTEPQSPGLISTVTSFLFNKSYNCLVFRKSELTVIPFPYSVFLFLGCFHPRVPLPRCLFRLHAKKNIQHVHLSQFGHGDRELRETRLWNNTLEKSPQLGPQKKTPAFPSTSELHWPWTSGRFSWTPPVLPTSHGTRATSECGRPCDTKGAANVTVSRSHCVGSDC